MSNIPWDQLAARELPKLHEVQESYVAHVIERCGGNVARAARVLGITRRALYRRGSGPGVQRWQLNRREVQS